VKSWFPFDLNAACTKHFAPGLQWLKKTKN
jgi:hypothetical protein